MMAIALAKAATALKLLQCGGRVQGEVADGHGGRLCGGADDAPAVEAIVLRVEHVSPRNQPVDVALQQH